jgi:hypothetical protein
MNQGAQNIKMGTDALGTAENEFESAKHEIETRRPPYRRKCARVRKTRKWDLMPLVPPKMSPGAQNIKTGPDTLGTAKNEFESAKHENVSRRTRHHRKRVRARKISKKDPTQLVPPKTSLAAQNMKTGPDALGNTENESRRAKHENGTGHPR